MTLSAVSGLLLCAAFLLFAKPQLAERRPELQDSDLVIVMGSCGSRLDLAHSTARAAKGSSLLRTVVVVENDTLAQQLNRHFGRSLNETYLSWPDRPDPRKPGDSRVAMVPWLAHRALGETYKWFLYGDDGGEYKRGFGKCLNYACGLACCRWALSGYCGASSKWVSRDRDYPLNVLQGCPTKIGHTGESICSGKTALLHSDPGPTQVRCSGTTAPDLTHVAHATAHVCSSQTRTSSCPTSRSYCVTTTQTCRTSSQVRAGRFVPPSLP